MNAHAPRLLLTPQEAADSLGIGRTRLFALLGDGVIASVMIGRSRRVPVAALTRYVDSLTAVGAVRDDQGQVDVRGAAV